MQATLWILVIDMLLWAAVFGLHAISFHATELRPFELKRRVDDGDGDAVKTAKREKLLPRIQTLRLVIASVLLVLATALSIVGLGWIFGTLVASMFSLLTGVVSHTRLIRNLADTLYQPREAFLLELVSSWRWLDWFNGVMVENRDITVASKAELQHIVEQSRVVLTHDEFLRFQASLSLDSRQVQDVMTPASVVEVADVHDTLGPLVLDGLHKTGHNRFPVINKDIHHIVGILYLRDVINLKNAKATVKDAMDPRVFYIHEAQTLEHALHGFLRTHHHMFIVVNEYRETVGVLTLEDVLENLLGKKIVDEFDKYEDLRAVAENNPRRNNVPKGKTDV